MSKPRDPAKEQFWRQTLEDWQQSGLAVSVFCRQRQLEPQSFFRWRKLLCLRDQPRAAASQPATGSPDGSPLFVPVHVRPPLPVSPPPAFEVVLRCGRLLRLSPGFDPACLRSLLLILEEAPC